jgi:hypothetical protein
MAARNFMAWPVIASCVMDRAKIASSGCWLLSTSEPRLKNVTDAYHITEKREGRFDPMHLAICAWIVLSVGVDCTLGMCEMSTKFGHLHSSKLI